MRSGTPIHHFKRIDASILDRWSRKIGECKVRKQSVPSSSDVSASVSTPNPPASPLVPSPKKADETSKGECSKAPAAPSKGECSQAPSNAPVDPPGISPREKSSDLSKTQDLGDDGDDDSDGNDQGGDHPDFDSGKVASSAKGKEILQSVESPKEQIPASSEGETHFDDQHISAAEFVQDKEEPLPAPSPPGNEIIIAHVREVLQPASPVKDRAKDKATLERLYSLDDVDSDEFLFAEDDFGISSRPLAPSPTPENLLLLNIERMLIRQKQYFEFSLKQVREKVKVIEHDLNNGLCEVAHCVDLFKKNQDDYFVQGAATLKHVVDGLEFVNQNTRDLPEGQRHIYVDGEASRSSIQNSLESMKTEIIQTLTEEVRKGEERLHERIQTQVFDLHRELEGRLQESNIHFQTQIRDLSRDLESRFQESNAYVHQSHMWLHAELTRGYGFGFQGQGQSSQQVFNPQEFNPEIQFAAPSEPFEPPEHYYWSDDNEESSRKRARTDQGEPSEAGLMQDARRAAGPRFADPRAANPRRFDGEVWSPESRNIILDTYNLIMNSNEPSANHYDREEINRWQISMLKRRIHFRNHRDDSDPPLPPPKYFPKPRAYFDRQLKKSQKGKGHEK